MKTNKSLNKAREAASKPTSKGSMTYKEMAKLTGMGINTMRTRYSTNREELFNNAYWVNLKTDARLLKYLTIKGKKVTQSEALSYLDISLHNLRTRIKTNVKEVMNNSYWERLEAKKGKSPLVKKREEPFYKYLGDITDYFLYKLTLRNM